MGSSSVMMPGGAFLLEAQTCTPARTCVDLIPTCPSSHRALPPASGHGSPAHNKLGRTPGLLRQHRTLGTAFEQHQVPDHIMPGFKGDASSPHLKSISRTGLETLHKPVFGGFTGSLNKAPCLFQYLGALHARYGGS